MTWLHNVYFHVWHWLFQQVQLDVWFGNIVAGVVGYVAGGRRLLRDPKLHAKLDHIIHHHPDIPDFPGEK